MHRNPAFQALTALALVLIVALAGCSPAAAPQVAAVPPTKTPKPTFTPTIAVTPTALPIPTETVVPTATTVPASPTPAPTATPQAAQLSANQNVNVRMGPGTNYQTIGQLKAGDTKKIMAKNDDASWLQFNYEGDPGWVSAALVSVTGSTDAVQVAENIAPPPVVVAQPVAVQPAPAQPKPQPAAPAAPTAVPAPPKPSYPFSLVKGAERCDPNEGTTYFNGVVRYPNNSPMNGVCVHINVYGPRQTKCSGCGGVGDGNWGFSPFGGNKPGAGTQVEIYVVSCDGVPAGGQNEISGFANLSPKSDKWVRTLKGGEQCTGITFVSNN